MGEVVRSRILILGAGMSGIGVGMSLRRRGETDFLILEKHDRVGGTWRDNRYPGVACDVPSHLYSFSFAPNPDWSRLYSPGDEIWRYFERCVETGGLAPHLRFGVEATGAAWDDERRLWSVRTRGGTVFEAQVLLTAMGGLHRPKLPELPGLERFRGPAFHSARWPDGVDLSGRRVVVVGSAASAVQLVPRLAEQVAHQTVVQRTPNWIRPRNDVVYPESWKRTFRRLPVAGRLHRALIWGVLESRFPLFKREGAASRRERRLCLQHLEAQVSDPALRAKLVPDYPPGCKRILISDDFYPALGRPNVTLETRRIAEVVPDGLRLADGEVVAADAMVWATGFHVDAHVHTFEVTGRGGRSLAEAWTPRVHAHRTLTVPGFPNLFLLFGPNSGLGHSSIIFMVECQIGYVLQCLDALGSAPGATIEPTAEAFDADHARVQRDLKRTIWTSGCKSWYQDERGEIWTLWPHSTVRFWHELRRLRLGEYTLRR